MLLSSDPLEATELETVDDTTVNPPRLSPSSLTASKLFIEVNRFDSFSMSIIELTMVEPVKRESIVCNLLEKESPKIEVKQAFLNGTINLVT